jgi:hypothetical protein
MELIKTQATALGLIAIGTPIAIAITLLVAAGGGTSFPDSACLAACAQRISRVGEIVLKNDQGCLYPLIVAWVVAVLLAREVVGNDISPPPRNV